ncbi:MAG: hypothetical protein EOO11_19740 [Chitinophagaceae bacterium]|nr:MAG: hypothetical protein EOO11_19740 [Chitinophagaceae bacterium]
MNNRTFLLLFLLPACTDGPHESPDPAAPAAPSSTDTTRGKAFVADSPQRIDSIRGDFNGDGQPEWAWLVPPAHNSDSMECADGACVASIRFSDGGLPPIAVRQCIGGTPDNLGDLYGDGRDVLGLDPDWFTSCWHGYYTWTFRAAGWKPALDTLSTHCIQWDEGKKAVEKIPGRPGWARVRWSESTDDSILVRTEARPLRKY